MRTTKLTAFVADRMQEAEMQCGGAAALRQLYLSKVDPFVLEQIQKELNAGSG